MRRRRGRRPHPLLEAYLAFFAAPFNLPILSRTHRDALLTTLPALVIAYPTAFSLARFPGLLQAVILVAMVLPLSVDVIVKAFGWSILFRTNGALNETLMSIGLIDQPVRMLFTETDLVIVAHAAEIDAAVIAAFGDSSLQAARELFDLPVVGWPKRRS